MCREVSGKGTAKSIRAQKLRWLGNVERMEVGTVPRKIMEGRLFIGRRKGRHNLRWMHDVVECS
jgi:hypothetical protein